MLQTTPEMYVATISLWFISINVIVRNRRLEAKRRPTATEARRAWLALAPDQSMIDFLAVAIPWLSLPLSKRRPLGFHAVFHAGKSTF